jgi:hypothetical protein
MRGAEGRAWEPGQLYGGEPAQPCGGVVRLRLGVPLLVVAILLTLMGCYPPVETSPPAPPGQTGFGGANSPTLAPDAGGRAAAEPTGDDSDRGCTVDLPSIARNSAGSPPGWWQPPVPTSWQWQLTGLPIDPSFDADMYDIDLFDNEASTVAALHGQGRRVICYISAGSWEDWRPDADQFPASVLGHDYEGWPGEKWLDIRQIDLLAPVMRARLDQCRAKGFDGVEPDNIDGYANDTGFPLTYQDQLEYNIWLAGEAHGRGLSIGLKNDGEQVADLLPYFDWALAEDCFAQDWCGELQPFVAAGKAVFAAEYTDEMSLADFLSQVCPRAYAMGFAAILKHRELDAWRGDCP